MPLALPAATPSPTPTPAADCQNPAGCTAAPPQPPFDQVVQSAKDAASKAGDVAHAAKDGVVDLVTNNPVAKTVTNVVDFASDPAAYWSSKIHEAVSGITSKLLTWLYEMVQPDLNVAWFLDSYKTTFGLSIIIMGFIVIFMLVKAARRPSQAPMVFQALITRVPIFIIGGMFAPAAAIMLLKVASSLVDMATKNFLGMAAGDVVTALTGAIISMDPVGVLGGAMTGIVGGIAIFFGLLLVAAMLITTLVAMYFSGVIFPLGWVWYINPATQRAGKAILGIWVSLMFAPPLVFMMMGIGAKMMTGLNFNIADAGLKALVNMIVFIVILLMIACSPFALLKFAQVTPWSNPTEGPEWDVPKFGAGSGSGSSDLASMSDREGSGGGDDDAPSGSRSGRIAALAGGGDQSRQRALEGAKAGAAVGPEGAAVGAAAGAAVGAGEDVADTAAEGVDAAVDAAAQAGDLAGDTAEESATSQIAGESTPDEGEDGSSTAAQVDDVAAEEGSSAAGGAATTEESDIAEESGTNAASAGEAGVGGLAGGGSSVSSGEVDKAGSGAANGDLAGVDDDEAAAAAAAAAGAATGGAATAAGEAAATGSEGASVAADADGALLSVGGAGESGATSGGGATDASETAASVADAGSGSVGGNAATPGASSGSGASVPGAASDVPGAAAAAAAGAASIGDASADVSDAVAPGGVAEPGNTASGPSGGVEAGAPVDGGFDGGSTSMPSGVESAQSVGGSSAPGGSVGGSAGVSGVDSPSIAEVSDDPSYAGETSTTGGAPASPVGGDAQPGSASNGGSSVGDTPTSSGFGRDPSMEGSGPVGGPAGGEPGWGQEVPAGVGHPFSNPWPQVQTPAVGAEEDAVLSWMASGAHLLNKTTSGGQSIGQLAADIAQGTEWLTGPEREA